MNCVYLAFKKQTCKKMNQPIKIMCGLISCATLLLSCETKTQTDVVHQTGLPIVGTWQLISGTTIEKGDTTITYYTKNLSFIKIINDTHFAFLKHDLTKGKDSTASFGAGGGHYSLKDSTYTEHLEYCSDREWENNDFPFTITIQNDTLVQQGVEKVEGAGVNRLNIERYVRLKK
jgi:hypothetical protein